MGNATNRTNNMGLSQFVGTDKPNWLDDYNEDMRAIDVAFGSAARKGAVKLGSRQNFSITSGETALVPNIGNGTLFWVGTNCGHCFGLRYGTVFFLFGSAPGDAAFISQISGLGTVDLAANTLTLSSLNAVRINSGGTISNWNTNVIVYAVAPIEV